MALIVQKFDLKHVTDEKTLDRVVENVSERYKNGDLVLVVVSQKFEGSYFEKGNCSKREFDVIISSKENEACALLAIELERRGFFAVSFNGFQTGIITDTTYGNAKIKNINTERIFRELDKKFIVIVTGNQGINKFEDVTTLGIGGHDTSAVALAAALKADVCEIYTDSHGIYTADRDIVKNAKMISEISYDELLELANLGFSVIPNRALELARKYSVPILIKSIFTENQGTMVKEVGKVERQLIRGVTRDNEIARVAVLGIQDKPGVAYKLFSILAKEDVLVDIIVQSVGREGINDISFTVSKKVLDKTIKVLNDNLEVLNASEILYSDKFSKVSVVGTGVVNNPKITSMLFEALYENDINIEMISTSEIKISVLVDVNDSERAVRAIHDKFRMDE